MDYFWKFYKNDGHDTNLDDISDKNICINIELYLLFKIVKLMRKKHHSVFDEHMRYVKSDIQKPYKLRRFHYYEWLRKMFDLGCYLSTPSKKCEEYHYCDW